MAIQINGTRKDHLNISLTVSGSRSILLVIPDITSLLRVRAKATEKQNDVSLAKLRIKVQYTGHSNGGLPLARAKPVIVYKKSETATDRTKFVRTVCLILN